MTTEFHTANSKTTPIAAGVQTTRQQHIGVKEAARLLGVSRSAVYRMDRVHGSIRFLSTKRPITIDSESVETYLASSRPVEPEPETNAADLAGAGAHELKGLQADQDQAAEVPNTELTPSAPTLRSSGQRELTMPRQERASFLMYMTTV